MLYSSSSLKHKETRHKWESTHSDLIDSEPCHSSCGAISLGVLLANWPTTVSQGFISNGHNPHFYGTHSYVLSPHACHLFWVNLLNTLSCQLSFLPEIMFWKHLEQIIKLDAVLSTIHLCCPFSCLVLVAKEISVKWGPCPKGLMILYCSLSAEVIICCVWNHI